MIIKNDKDNKNDKDDKKDKTVNNNINKDKFWVYMMHH